MCIRDRGYTASSYAELGAGRSASYTGNAGFKNGLLSIVVSPYYTMTVNDAVVPVYACLLYTSTVILLATILVWFTSSFGFKDGSFGMVEMNDSLLAAVGNGLAWIFAPLGWGDWKAAVAAITGLIAKENVVGTFGVLYSGMEEVAENGWQIWANMRQEFTALSAYSFLVFNLLCAPCFAAIGAIKREMNSAKWTWFAIGYQCVFAYAVSLCIYQLGTLFTGGGFGVFTVVAFLLVAIFLFLLFRPYKESNTLKTKVRV